MGILSFSLVLFLFILSIPVQAIPDTDIYNFRAVGSQTFVFDEYCTGSECNRTIRLKSFHNFSNSFYIMFRHHTGDAEPYDSYNIEFRCSGDALPLAFNTNDYAGWEERGIISFKREFGTYVDGNSYDNITIDTHYSDCEIISANSLTVDGNTGYTTFTVEVVPILDAGSVTTVQTYCETEARNDLIANLQSGIWTVLENNINFFFTIWIIAQTLGIILVVIGIPVLVFLMIRWAIWKVTGIKLLERKEKMQVKVE
jgi:hypothetical protein